MGKAVGGHPEATALAARAAERAQGLAAAAEGSEERAHAANGDGAFALGAWLARQRELRGIRLEELSILTRLPLRSLERLEAGVFDGQQDGFVRGFVRAVSIAIGLDPEDAVARLLAEPVARPRRRWPDPRRVVLVAVGLAGSIAAAAALWQWSQTPPGAVAASAEAPLLRRDPVRALAIERGLLDEGPTREEPLEALWFEPTPADPDPDADAAGGPPAVAPGADDRASPPATPQ